MLIRRVHLSVISPTFGNELVYYNEYNTSKKKKKLPEASKASSGW